MPKELVGEIMSQNVISLKPEQSVAEAAGVLTHNHIGGAPVLDENGRLIGMVSESDLIIQDVKLHFPSYIHFLDSYIYLESLSKFEHTLKKAVAAKVKDVMSADVVALNPNASIQEIATLMTNKGIGRVVIVDDSKVVGIVSKGDIVKSLE